jgi:hypothetical protein
MRRPGPERRSIQYLFSCKLLDSFLLFGCLPDGNQYKVKKKL